MRRQTGWGMVSYSVQKEEREERKEGKGSFRVLIWPTGTMMIRFLGSQKTGRGAGLVGKTMEYLGRAVFK